MDLKKTVNNVRGQNQSCLFFNDQEILIWQSIHEADFRRVQSEKRCLKGIYRSKFSYFVIFIDPTKEIVKKATPNCIYIYLYAR